MRITRRTRKRVPKWRTIAGLVVLGLGSGLAAISGSPAVDAADAQSPAYTAQPTALQATQLDAKIVVNAKSVLTAPATPKIPRSAESCNANYPTSKPGQNICINIVGSSNYVQYIRVGVGMHAFWNVSGFYRIYSVYPAADGFSYTTGDYGCRSGIGAIYICWFPVNFAFNRYIDIPAGNGRTPHQEICVKFYHPDGASQGGPACDDVFK